MSECCIHHKDSCDGDNCDVAVAFSSHTEAQLADALARIQEIEKASKDFVNEPRNSNNWHYRKHVLESTIYEAATTGAAERIRQEERDKK